MTMLRGCLLSQQFVSKFLVNCFILFISAHPFKKPCIHWSFDDGSPYVLVETTVFECQHGKDRNKIKNNNRKRVSFTHADCK